jgi:phenylalanyl-tRNA synthetase beta chain
MQQLTIDENVPAIYSVGQSYALNGKPICTIGAFKTSLTAKLGISQAVLGAIIQWDTVVALAQKSKVNYKEVSKFPEVRRDLAIVLEKQVPYTEVEKLAFKTNKHLLKKVNLFDVYEGDKIEAGKKSYAISLILQEETKTLTDKDIDNFMQKLERSLEKELGAKIRR